MKAIRSKVLSIARSVLPHQMRVGFTILVTMAAVALSVWASSAAAQSSGVYVCKGANGVPEYRNGNPGNSKDSKKLNLPDVVTVPGGRTSGGTVTSGAK